MLFNVLYNETANTLVPVEVGDVWRPIDDPTELTGIPLSALYMVFLTGVAFHLAAVLLVKQKLSPKFRSSNELKKHINLVHTRAST